MGPSGDGSVQTASERRFRLQRKSKNRRFLQFHLIDNIDHDSTQLLLGRVTLHS